MSALGLRKSRRLAVRFTLFTGIPTLIAAVYLCFVATPQYESSAVISVQSSQGSRLGTSLLSVLIPSASSGRDTLLVREYIRSRDMLQLLSRRERVLDHYRRPSADWWSRLHDGASSEKKLGYYRGKIRTDFHSKTNTLRVSVRAFTADDAQRILRALLGYAEQMVNRLSDRTRKDRLKLAEQELASAETRLTKVRSTLTQLRARHGTVDAAGTATAEASIVAQIELKLAQARTKLAVVRANRTETAPRVAAARRRVASLEHQLAQQRRGVRGAKVDTMAQSIAQFDAALLEQELAQRLYGNALKSLELARVEASRQHSYLVTVSEPSRPNVAAYPRRLFGIGKVFFAAFALMGVLTLLGAAAREHASI